MLTERENNYLASVHMDHEGLSVTYCDISTGELNVTEYKGTDLYETLLNELVKIKAKEIIVNRDFAETYDVEEIRLRKPIASAAELPSSLLYKQNYSY